MKTDQTSSGARVIDLATDRHQEYFRQRQEIEKKLPAYSRDALAISYSLESPGISIRLQTGPYEGTHFCRGYPALHTFHFEYNPAELPLLSPARIPLGLHSFTAGPKDMIVAQAHFSGIDGVWLDLYFKKGPAENCRVLIHRDSGKAVFDGLQEGALLKEILQGLAYEWQAPGDGTSGLVGRWTKITNEVDVFDLNAENLPPRNLLGTTTAER